MTESLHLLTSLAWRNLWRNRRRTLVILFAMVLGVWAMVVMSAFMRGISSQAIEDTFENLTGHIQIHAPTYLDDPVIDHAFDIDATLADALTNPSIKDWGSRIRVPAVVTSERESVGLVLLGVEPKKEARLSLFANAVVEGRFLEDVNDEGIVIGKKLAERLETKLGRRIVIMSENSDNDIEDRGVRIVGIFDAPTEASETGFVFMGQRTVSELLGTKGQVSEVVILLNDVAKTDETVASLRRALPDLDVQPWYKIEPYTKILADVYDSFHVIWHLIIFLAMGFGIINTLLMAVFERTREFGLFQALGLKPRFILGQVWMEAFMLLVVALVLGNLVSWLTVLATGEGIDVSAFAQGMEMANLSNIIPFVIVAGDLAVANAVVIILGMLTSLYPAWRASRLVPADAITRV